MQGEHAGVRNGQQTAYAERSAINARAEGQWFIPKGVVITTLATEAWLMVFLLVAGANAALSWLV